MSEDEFGTVNVKRQQMARELETLKQRYLAHRETLARLEADAPSEQLAARYAQLQNEIATAMSKLDDLGSGRTSAPAPTTARASIPTAPGTTPVGNPGWQNRSVLNVDHSILGDAPTAPLDAASEDDAGKRLLLIGLVTVAILVLLGYVAWRYSRRHTTSTPVIVERDHTTTTETAPVSTVTPIATDSVITTEPVAPKSNATGSGKAKLEVTPVIADFGSIKKGSSALRQFQIVNHSGTPLQVDIKRSKCRCLWFDYDKRVPANGSTILAVKLDGVRAKVGALDEQVEVTAKEAKASFRVQGRVDQ